MKKSDRFFTFILFVMLLTFAGCSAVKGPGNDAVAITQLPKFRMNFFGLHTYPQGSIGLTQVTQLQ